MARVVISCAGDFLASDTEYTLERGVGSHIDRLLEYYTKEPENHPFRGADIAFCNLESPVTSAHNTVPLPFEGNPAAIQLLKLFGVGLVSIANNHILEHGREGYDQTIKLLEENQIRVIGKTISGISKIEIFEINAKKIAFAAFNAIHDTPPAGLYASLDSATVLKTLFEIKAFSPEYIIFSFHWGNEYMHYPSPSQVTLAHELIDKGVSVIIGHHPHAIQPVEKYQKGLIIYSLGNFLFDMFWSASVHHGMIVDLILDETIDYRIRPFRINKDFTLDFNRTKFVLSTMKRNAVKTAISFSTGKSFMASYERAVHIRHWISRLQMKIYLVLHWPFLSRRSRKIFRNNVLHTFRNRS